MEHPWDVHAVNGVCSSTVIPHDPYAESLALIHASDTRYAPCTPHDVKDADKKDRSAKKDMEAERSRSRRHKRKAMEKQNEERIKELEEQLNAANALLKAREDDLALMKDRFAGVAPPGRFAKKAAVSNSEDVIAPRFFAENLKDRPGVHECVFHITTPYAAVRDGGSA